MTLQELFDQFRSDVDDETQPVLWSDTDLERYFNWALEELAKRANYFYDTTTWAALTITADDPKVTASAANKMNKIHDITRAKLASQQRDLKVCSATQAMTAVGVEDYGQVSAYSWEQSSGTPRVLVTDYYGISDPSLRLGPIPGASDTLTIWAFRLPLQYYTLDLCGDVDLADSVYVTDFTHQTSLIQGMKYRAYLKEDPETRDTKLASEASDLFSRDLSDIRHELQLRRTPAGPVRYGGL